MRHNAQLTRKLAAPMCRRKCHAFGDSVSMYCARPPTGVASARWDKVRRPMGLPGAADCDRAWTLTRISSGTALDNCTTLKALLLVYLQVYKVTLVIKKKRKEDQCTLHIIHLNAFYYYGMFNRNNVFFFLTDAFRQHGLRQGVLRIRG